MDSSNEEYTMEYIESNKLDREEAFKNVYSFSRTLSDIINSAVRSGMTIKSTITMLS